MCSPTRYAARARGCTGWPWRSPRPCPPPPRLADAPSDEEGGFGLAGLPPGVFQVEAEAEGFAPAVATGIRSGETALDLVLEEGFTIHGKVIDAGTLQPIEGAEVVVYCHSGGRSAYAAAAPRAAGDDARNYGGSRAEGCPPDEG